jgi:hypothetical protein
VSKDTDIRAKVQYFESEATRFDTMTGEDRARMRKEMVKFYDDLDPTKRTMKYAGAGAVAAGVLPGIGWIAGGLIGAAVAAVTDDEVGTWARDRMKNLIDRVG